MSDSPPPADEPADSQADTTAPAGPRTRSGTSFIVGAGAFLALFLGVILVVSPRLQANLGLTEGARDLRTPPAPVEVALTVDGRQVGRAVWDAQGVCAEITDDAGQTFRSCARPDPLRPIWGIDAPDEADPGYLLIASPPEVASIGGLTTGGDSLDGLTQARELPAAWTIIPLADGQVVGELVAFDVEGADLGNAECGTEESSSDGPGRLAGGCFIPRQD